MLKSLTLALILLSAPATAQPLDQQPHRSANHTNVCSFDWYRGEQAQPSTYAIDRLISCWAPKARFPERVALCIADSESHDYPYADNGHGDQGVYQESDFGMVWRYFKASHPGRWVEGKPGVFNGRSNVLADVWWMSHYGTGRWSTAPGCGG